jgi:hypothetical protein
MDPTISALQATINRFAVVGGFPRVDVDGGWGPKTRQGVYSALAWVGQGKCYQQACPTPETTKAAAGVIAAWDETMASARGLNEFLAGVANELGIPHVASPVPSGGGVPGGVLTRLPSFSMGLLDRFKMMPIWQQIAIGVAAGLGLIFVANRIQHARGKRRRA